MGHDAHFLSRLDRVDRSEADLALKLYREHRLVRRILREARFTHQGERIALSLDCAKEGPFVIVARDGHFVTCLARGMKPKWPVVSRADLDRSWVHWKSFLSAKSHFSEEDPDPKLVKRAFTEGGVITAEDVPGLRMIFPLIEGEVLGQLLATVGPLALLNDKMRDSIHRRHSGRRRGTASYFRASWVVRNMILLLGSGCCKTLRDIQLTGTILTKCAVQTEFNHLMVSSGWAAAKVGPDAFGAFARAAAKSSEAHQRSGVLGLCCIASRHPETLNDALTLLKSTLFKEHSMAREAGVEALLILKAKTLEQEAIQLANETFSTAREKGRERMNTERALQLLSHTEFSSQGQTARFQRSLIAAMLASRGEAEGLCLPSQLVHSHPINRPDAEILREVLALYPREAGTAPERRPELPGRNDPCLCESGRKFKKCCGRSPLLSGAAAKSSGNEAFRGPRSGQELFASQALY